MSTNAGDGSGRLFVVEQTGHIRVFKNGAFNWRRIFSTFTPLVSYDGGEKGLLGRVSPELREQRVLLRLLHRLLAADLQPDDRALHVSGNPDVADPASALILLQVPTRSTPTTTAAS